jgi:hypothetical protein
VSFDVPEGTDQLDGTIAQPSRMGAGLTLLDPHGRLAGYSDPQGPGNHGEVVVAHPEPGRWTANILGLPVVGTVHYQFAARRFATGGSVWPAKATLEPGESGRFRASVTLPAGAGDSSRDLIFESDAGNRTLVPLALRALVQLGPEGGAFAGDLVGGNGRMVAWEQQDTFEFDVPRGEDVLNVRVRFPDPAGTDFIGVLVNPNGDAVGAHDSVIRDESGGLAESNFLAAHAVAPHPGRWRFVLAVKHTGGNAISQPYRGVVDFDAPPVKTAGLPASAGTVIKAGTSHMATVTITNDGDAPELLFLDARLPWEERYALLPLGPDRDVPLPAYVPYVVPTHTSTLDTAVEATAPVSFMWGAGFSLGPDRTGTHATGHISAPELTSGIWSLWPALSGPFDAPASATANTGMVARTLAFDADVTAGTTDLWREFVAPGAPPGDLVFLPPGETVDIPITFTPRRRRGAVVRGTIYVNDWDVPLGRGNDIAAIPYAYRVG